MILALAALLTLAVIASRQSQGAGAKAPALDANLPADVKTVVLQLLQTEGDSQRLRLLAATLPGYPKAQAALEARARLLDSALQENVTKISRLLASIKDPAWRTKVQSFLLKVADLPSLEILAASLTVGEPAAAQVLRLKIAALSGRSSYTPLAPPVAANDPGALNVFANGQFQGCDTQPGCDPKMAVFGNGKGPLGLDMGLAALSPDALDCLLWLLVTLPATFAKAFPHQATVQGDPTASLAQTLNAIELTLRKGLPMTATSLRLKSAFLMANKDALNLAAKAALAVQQVHTGMTWHQAIASGRPEIAGLSAPWLRAQAHTGQDMMERRRGRRAHSGEWSAIEDAMGARNAHFLNRSHTGEWSAIEDAMGARNAHFLNRAHSGEWSAIEDAMGARNAHFLHREHSGEWSAIEDAMGQSHYLHHLQRRTVPATAPSIVRVGQFLPVSQEGYSDFGWSAEDLPNDPTGYGWSSEDMAPRLVPYLY